MRVFLLLVLMAGPAFGLGKGPAPTDAELSYDKIAKSRYKKIVKKAESISSRLWEAGYTSADKQQLVDEAFQEFLDWLIAEYGEASRPIEEDIVLVAAAAKVVFSNACLHNKALYVESWSIFLSVVLKHAASTACASYPQTLPAEPLCKFAGHLVGKYGGMLAGAAIHDGFCAPGAFGKSLSVDAIDGYKYWETPEYRDFKRNRGL